MSGTEAMYSAAEMIGGCGVGEASGWREAEKRGDGTFYSTEKNGRKL